MPIRTRKPWRNPRKKDPIARKMIVSAAVDRESEEVFGSFEVSSQPGNEIEAMNTVARMIAPLDVPVRTLERVKTAVAECVMNAMEHGNQFQKDLPVKIWVTRRGNRLRISVCDLGGERDIPTPDRPDLEAKLAGLQSSRGWGLFLIEHMVDELKVSRDGRYHIVDLIFHLGASRR